MHVEQATEPHLQTLMDLNIINLPFCFPVPYDCDAGWLMGHSAHVNSFLRLSALSQGSIREGSKPYNSPCAQGWSLTEGAVVHKSPPIGDSYITCQEMCSQTFTELGGLKNEWAPSLHHASFTLQMGLCLQTQTEPKASFRALHVCS